MTGQLMAVELENPAGHDLTTLGGRIAWARQRANMTVLELARLVDCQPQAVYSVENGTTKRLASGNWQRYSQALGVEEGWLRTGEGTPDAALLTDALFLRSKGITDEARIEMFQNFVKLLQGEL